MTLEGDVYRNQNGMFLYLQDMSRIPSGWVVVLKTDGDDTFRYSSPHWSDTTTELNAKSNPAAPGNAKYPAYNSQSFDAIKACVGSLDNCIPPHVFDGTVQSAAELFGGFNRREGVTIADFTTVFAVEDPRRNLECEPQKAGFNSQCTGGNRV
eukprot:COSAG02_NODE_36317_length_456_cov_0.865546_1_plen_152_part_11